MLRENKLDDKEIEIDIQALPIGVEIMAPPGHGGDDQPVAGHVPEPLGQPAQDAQGQGQPRR
jgi:ATP-dependent protease HslVU (ClpYQ) ATPase subunit